jgi:hypothetical protein
MRLDEIALQPVFDKKAILAELAKLKIESTSKINADGTVDVSGNVKIPREYTQIPIQFRNVSDDFCCSGSQITSLQSAPQYVGGDFLCNKTQITSLHNIHKTHSNWVIDGKLLLPETCTHLLGLAYIPGVKRVQLGPDENVIDIIHDVFEWQEKLLEMGLTEQAQL